MNMVSLAFSRALIGTKYPKYTLSIRTSHPHQTFIPYLSRRTNQLLILNHPFYLPNRAWFISSDRSTSAIHVLGPLMVHYIPITKINSSKYPTQSALIEKEGHP